MSLNSVFTIAGSAMSAQSTRLNTVASNLANADTVSSSVGETYKARSPVFSAVLADQFNQQGAASVKVVGIVESDAPPQMEYSPGHPMANDEGYIFRPNINVMESMANMISASRSYETNVEVFNTTKELIQQTIQMGR